MPSGERKRGWSSRAAASHCARPAPDHRPPAAGDPRLRPIRSCRRASSAPRCRLSGRRRRRGAWPLSSRGGGAPPPTR
jgi:hypothetical protein